MSQRQRIKEWMEKGNKLTPLTALSLFGCFRLSARILELRNSGLNIKMEMKEYNGKRFAEYSIN